MWQVTSGPSNQNKRKEDDMTDRSDMTHDRNKQVYWKNYSWFALFMQAHSTVRSDKTNEKVQDIDKIIEEIGKIIMKV